MLIRLLATNFLSFNEETEFNMLSSSDQRTHKDHVYSHNGLDLLKGAALYGANGAGKSNLVRAIAALRALVLGEGKNHLSDLNEFKLSSIESRPTTLEIEFIKEGVPFLYGLSVHYHQIIEEWLYTPGFKDGSNRLLFHRKRDTERLILEFSDSYIETPEDQFRLKFYQNELLKDDELLLTELASLKEGFKEVKQAFSWFEENLLIVFPQSKPEGLAFLLGALPHFVSFANDYICSSDTGIDKLEVMSKDFKDVFGSQYEELTKEVTSDLQNGKKYATVQSINRWGSRDDLTAVIENGKPVIKQLVTKHLNKKGQSVNFSLFEESDGTNRLFDFIAPFFEIINRESVVIIDEIDQSIHPALLKELVKKFMDNPATKGQLIFTTHESNLLDQQLFRRDEIWFVEKHDGATQLYPLSDFDIRQDLDIRKGYLNGRFGAIPFLGNLKDLNWEQYAEA